MQLPISISVFGAAAVAGVAILVCGRVLRSAIIEMGNPALDHRARMLVGGLCLMGMLMLIGAALTATALTDAETSPSDVTHRAHAIGPDAGQAAPNTKERSENPP